jgi:hypothetical protein
LNLSENREDDGEKTSNKNNGDENDNVNASAPFFSLSFFLFLSVHFAQLSKQIVMERKRRKSKKHTIITNKQKEKNMTNKDIRYDWITIFY